MSNQRLEEIEREERLLLNMLDQINQNESNSGNKENTIDINIPTDSNNLDRLRKIEEEEKQLQFILKQLDNNNTNEFSNNNISNASITKSKSKYEPSYLRSFAKGARNFIAGTGDPFFVGDTLGKSLDYLTSDYTKPETDAEKLTEMGTRAIGSAAIAQHPLVKAMAVVGTAGNVLSKSDKARQLIGKYLTMGYAPTIGNTLSNAAQSAAVERSLQLDPDNPLQAIGTGMLTGHIADKIPSMISKNPVKQLLKNSLGVNPKEFEKFEKAGMQPTLGDVTDKPIIKYLQNAISLRGDDNKLRDITERNIEQFKKNINISGEENLSKAGMYALNKDQGKKIYDLVQNEYARNEKKAFDLMKLDSDIEKLIKKNPELAEIYKVNPEKTKKYIIDIRNEHSTPGLKQELLSRPIGKQINTLEVDINKLSPEEANKYKQIIGEKAHGWGIYGGKPEDREMKKLYHELKEDIETHAQKVSPEAHKALKEANENYENFKKNTEPWLSSIMNSKNENAVADLFLNSINRGDSNFIRYANESLPLNEQLKIKQYVLKALGTENKGEFNFNKAYKSYNSLQPEVKEALFKNIPEDQKAVIENTFDVLKNIGSRATAVNTSNTAITKEIYEMFNDLGKAANDDLEPGLKRISGYLGMKWLSNKINDPEWIRSLAYANKINNKAQVPVLLNKLEETQFLPKKSIKKLKDSFFEGVEDFKANENYYKKQNEANSNVAPFAKYFVPEKLRKNYLNVERYKKDGLSDVISKTLFNETNDEEE